MISWATPIGLCVVLILSGAFYIYLRWRRSPQAYRAMTVLAACYFVAGAIAGGWLIRVASPKPVIAPTPATAAQGNPDAAPAGVAPVLKENYTGPILPIPQLHFDPAHAILPDSQLTPGDVFPQATKDDVCTPGWAREHRHVTGSDKAHVYSLYPGWHQTCRCIGFQSDSCCEVDHLIPLEIGGSNDVKNLWPQPQDPRPGSYEKDSLENDLHRRVCKGEMSLADAQKCIASDWVTCWEKYVVPEYGPEWAAVNKHGW
jgi:hypothetical protein